MGENTTSTMLPTVLGWIGSPTARFGQESSGETDVGQRSSSIYEPAWGQHVLTSSLLRGKEVEHGGGIASLAGFVWIVRVVRHEM